MKRIHFLLLSFCLTLALPAKAEESPYNKGVEAWRAKDYAEARRQWERSLAEGGPDEALNNLAYLLYYGKGGPTNQTKAVELWRKGAALAVSEAQSHLGRAYEEGGGVERSQSRAYAWYKCAIATSSRLSRDSKTERAIEQMATEALATLTPQLTSDNRAEGDKLAAEFIAKYSVPLQTRGPH